MATKDSVTDNTKTSRKPGKKPRLRAPRVLRPIGRYFRGAWYELGQVRWPDRKASWSLTLAVIIYSLIFAGIILGLDTLFQYVFKEIIL